MHCFLIGLVAALLPAIILAAPQAEVRAEGEDKGNGLPPCSMKARPCACPKGSTFGNSTTYVTIGARAHDVRGIVDNFFDMSWMGLSVRRSQGDRNTLGALRYFDVGAPPNTYELGELLLRIERGYDGSFGQSFFVSTVPVIVPGSNGAQQFNGYWVRLDLKPKRYQPSQTELEWNTWSCLTGNPFATEAFRESGFRNLTSILEKQGKIKAPSTTPFSIVHA